MTLLIDNDIASRVLEIDDAIDVIEDAFVQLGNSNAAFYPRHNIVSPTSEQGDYYVWGHLLGAIRDPPRLAFRFLSDVLVWEEKDGTVVEEKFNAEPGTYMGFIMLFDMASGKLLGLMNDGVIQHVRVGATAGVACDHLARDDATTVGILGSGGLARTYTEAFARVRDLTTVKVYSPTKAHREAFAEEMEAKLGIDVLPLDEPREVMRNIDIGATCTNAKQPVYNSEWLEEGLFLIDVSSPEISAETIEQADTAFTTAPQPYREKTIGGAKHRDRYRSTRGSGRYQELHFPSLSQVLVDEEHGRRTDDEIIYYNNRSAGIQFAAIADLVHRHAKDRNLGTEIPLEWFQQGIRN